PPNEFDVRASQTVPEASVPTFPQDGDISQLTNEQTVTFDTPASVEAGTKYAVVISSTNGDVDNYYIWGTTTDAYSGGGFCYVTGGSWLCDGTSDAVFATYVSPPPQVGIASTSVSFDK